MRSTMKAGALGLAAASALVLPGMAGAGGGGHCQAQELTTSKGTTSAIELGCYSPTVLYVGAGGEVTWTNRDAVPHTVTGLFGSWGNYEQFGLNESMAFTFDEAGVFPYFCVVHPTMQGVVVVGAEGVGAVAPPQEVATTIESTLAAAAAVSSAGGATLETPASSAAANGASASSTIAAGVGGIVLGALGMGWAPRLLRRR